MSRESVGCGSIRIVFSDNIGSSLSKFSPVKELFFFSVIEHFLNQFLS